MSKARTENIFMDCLKSRIKKLAANLSTLIPMIIVAGGLGFSSCSLGDSPAKTSATSQATGQTPMAAKPVPQGPITPGQGLQELSVREERGQTTLFLKFSRPLIQYRHFPLAQPARVVLDIPNDTYKGSTSTEVFQIDTSIVSALRLNESESNVRIVVEVAAATVPPYTISQEDGGLKIVVGSPDPNATAIKNITLLKDGKRTELIAGGPACPSIGEARISLPSAEAQLTSEKKYTGQKISLDFKDADIKNVFRLIGEVSGKNILVTDDVKQRLTVRLIEVPWDQALDLIIDTNGLAKEELDTVIRISTAARLTQDRRNQVDARNAARTAQLKQTSYINVNYAKAKDLVDKVKQIIKTGAEIVSDERSNTIVIRGTFQDVQEVTCMVSRLDVRTPQILIESNLIETTPTFARALGFRFQFDRAGGRFSTSAPAGPPFSHAPGQFAPPPSITINPDGSATVTQSQASFPSGLGGAIQFFQGRMGGLQNLLSTLEAAENEGNVKIVSRPSVVTLNNVTSTIKSQRVLRIALPSSTNIASGSGAAAGTAVATQEIAVGIQLSVTPQVSSDGFILMNIKVESSSVASSATVSTGTAGVIPFDTLTRNAEASVLVRDGETIVIGGILKDTATEATSGIPYLKDIPYLGWLFKNWSVQTGFEELLVFITPRIASAGSQNLPTAEELWREQMKATKGSAATSSQSTP